MLGVLSVGGIVRKVRLPSGESGVRHSGNCYCSVGVKGAEGIGVW